ncbi:hypothetical protein LMG29542_08424 [Paraburkholderia humisilvae]|uniref:DDE domain-containing protein n=1 Tax=Paraburkholderia humisilvae TaxID=627669 RepID=A0A6J5FBE1_9BURK|nr:hypothetical protein LMG29542_08424 [Paraburkholderia humisilvae]
MLEALIAPAATLVICRSAPVAPTLTTRTGARKARVLEVTDRRPAHGRGCRGDPLEALNAERSKPVKVRQSKYLNNIVEQDHRAIKRIVRPMPGFRDFRCARIILTGIEINEMNASHP